MQAMLWRRLDTPGHDACRLSKVARGWEVEGTAVFLEKGEIAHLRYRVAADASWHAEHGEVVGWIGAMPVKLAIVRQGGADWILNGSPVPEVRGCVDLDLSFTPATNLFALRRIALEVGEAADAPAAWLDTDTWKLVPLAQRYERRTESSYWYESPSAGYAEMIEVAAVGYVTQYTNLWAAE